MPRPVAESWRRATLAGLEPSSALDGLTYAEVDRGSALLAAASPVLDELNLRLDGTMYSTLLVGRDGRVAHRWCGELGARRAFDNLGIDVGASLLEEAVGTNAPGTVLETRTSMTINGSQHFAVPLRRFSCYGHPIFHPMTRRIEGVLDISALVEEAHPLLPPLVARAVEDIQQRLLDGSRVSDKQLLSAFQSAAGRRRRAVVAVGHDLQMSNQAALDLLGTTDVALLRILASEITDESDIDLTLESGAVVRVHATRVGGAHGGALLDLEPLQPRHGGATAPAAASVGPVVVAGPPGSGRSTEARRLAERAPVTVLTAAAALLDGSAAWARDFGAVVRAGQGTLCIEGADLLPDDLLELVATHVAERRAPRLVLVVGSLETLTGRAAALVGDCTQRVELAPLTSRLPELPTLVAAMLRDLGADPSLHLTPGVMRAFACLSWPGNLRELKAVLESVVARRRSGAVVLSDLPEAYRTIEPVRPMAPIERAERDAIVAALREHDGNKVRAAETLGISRTTLYAKMRTLRIAVY